MNVALLRRAVRVLAAGGALSLGLALPVAAQQSDPHAGHRQTQKSVPAAAATLPPLPENLPVWMDNKKKNHIYRKRGVHNDDIYNVPRLAYDLNAVSVGHAMAYEDLVTGKAAGLENSTFGRIDKVLKNPPRLMPDEAAISPTFNRRFGVLEQVFDWTHILHNQTIDVLASTQLTQAEKDAEIERLWKYYFESVPYAITPLPMNMAYLDGQPYSRAFRQKYPKVNGLFWGYHWLQGVMYDALYNKTLPQQSAVYEVLGKRYHETELYRTDRPFMPMFAEVSPVFSAKFPQIANAFDNLHMLHDMVNDILASDWITEQQKDEQIKRAIWLVAAEAHRGEKPGDKKAAGDLHDHRFMAGMPGMGMMEGSTEDLMYMEGMGWMSMADCHHCSMPLPEGKDAWRSSSVTADGWTMRVRCALCARDMAAETQGEALLTISTENPLRPLVLISDEQGNLKTDMTGVVFLEAEESHASCHEWSRVFTSKAAFDAYVKANPEYKRAKALTLTQWSEQHGKKPDTYFKPKGPVENPYTGGAREAERE